MWSAPAGDRHAAPVIPTAASDRRNAITSAISGSGEPSGSKSALGIAARLGGVSIDAGQDAVRARHPLAFEFVGEALGQSEDGALGRRIGAGGFARPRRCSGTDGDDAAPPGARIEGTTARHRLSVVMTLTRYSRSQWSASAASSEAIAKVPTVLTRPSTRPKRLTASSANAAHARGVEEVDASSMQMAAGIGQGAHDLFEPGRGPIRRHEARPLHCEKGQDSRAKMAGGTGHHDHSIGQWQAHGLCTQTTRPP